MGSAVPNIVELSTDDWTAEFVRRYDVIYVTTNFNQINQDGIIPYFSTRSEFIFSLCLNKHTQHDVRSYFGEALTP